MSCMSCLLLRDWFQLRSFQFSSLDERIDLMAVQSYACRSFCSQAGCLIRIDQEHCEIPHFCFFFFLFGYLICIFLNLFSVVLLSADVMKNVLHLHEDVLFRTRLYCFVASRKKKSNLFLSFKRFYF